MKIPGGQSTEFTLGFNGPEWKVDAGRDWLAWRDATISPEIEEAAG